MLLVFEKFFLKFLRKCRKINLEFRENFAKINDFIFTKFREIQNYFVKFLCFSKFLKCCFTATLTESFRWKKEFFFHHWNIQLFFFPLLAPTTLPVQYLTVYLSHAVCRHVFGSVFRIQIRTDPHKEMHASWIRIRIRMDRCGSGSRR